MDKYFNNTSLVKTVLKWKWHIAIITVVAAVLGAFFSGPTFITPLFKSEAILYPSNIAAYSDETYSEQMLQILQSQDIMDSVVERHDLLGHYEIDKSYKYWKTALIGEYRDKVSVSKTPYDAICIKVKDKDPQLACEMVNDIIELYDMKVANLHKGKRAEVIDMYERQLREKREYIDSLKREMAYISTKFGVTDISSQSREITRGYVSHSNNTEVKELKTNLEQYGADIISLKSLIESESVNYSNIKIDYEQELRFFNGNMTYSNILSAPFVADKKVYPIRWVVMALCGLGAFVLSVLFVFVCDEKISKK